MKGIIYKVTNKINGKIYIGKTVNSLNRRKYEHHCSKDSIGFHGAIKKYGKENFIWETIEECSEKELNIKECFYIKKYESYVGYNDYKGYNLTEGGDGAPVGENNPFCREDVKRKIRERLINNNPSKRPEVRKKISESLLGKKLPEEHKKNISNALRGHKNSSKGENNPKSKKFIIHKPNGGEIIVKGLRKYCRDNDLHPNLLRNKSHRGYWCESV